MLVMLPIKKNTHIHAITKKAFNNILKARLDANNYGMLSRALNHNKYLVCVCFGFYMSSAKCLAMSGCILNFFFVLFLFFSCLLPTDLDVHL